MKNQLKFIKNISDYYVKDRNRYYVASNNLPDNTIVYKKNHHFFCPENLVIYKLWENHCTATYIRHEVKDFIKLVNGRKKLIDIGASSGFFSAIFLKENPQSDILSVEPDEVAYGYLLKTIALNHNNDNGNSWMPIKAVMADYDGEITFEDGGFGGVVSNVVSNTDKGQRKVCYKLETLCNKYNFTPDIIKLDIESFEYEVILSSMDYLNTINANLQIEIHNELIGRRGLNVEKVYSALREIGYRGVGKEGDLNKNQLKKEVSHLHLIK